ncbi:hypothetical protein [Natronospora cellulosivora (SeqCode)]
MKRVSNIIIILLLLAILLILTNPDEEHFVNWAITQMKEDADTELEKILGDIVASPMLRMLTNREDYIFFSIFTVREHGEESTYFGALYNMFFKIPFL